jgi:hypothetical protein
MVSKGCQSTSPNFQKGWFGPYRIQYYLPKNIILLVIVENFDFNLVLVNINKLKPYRFMEDQTFQPILTKPNDFLPKEPLEETHFNNMFIK